MEESKCENGIEALAWCCGDWKTRIVEDSEGEFHKVRVGDFGEIITEMTAELCEPWHPSVDAFSQKYAPYKPYVKVATIDEFTAIDAEIDEKVYGDAFKNAAKALVRIIDKHFERKK